jgi:hypothetical protein
LPAIGAVVAAGLIVTLSLLAERLNKIEERVGFSPSIGLGPGVVLPAELAARGRAVFIPAYSHIYSGGGDPVQLEVTLSVRNTDPIHPIQVDSVRYLDANGAPVRALASKPLALGPLQTASYLVEQTDTSGGSGASFVVEWSAKDEINQPIFESIMINAAKGLAFTSRGVAIERHEDAVD